MAFLVGVIQTCITLFRLGDLTRFISNSVIVGFTLGAAILLALDQLRICSACRAAVKATIIFSSAFI